MMDFTNINEIISTTAFPALMCILMLRQNEKQRESHSKDCEELRKAIERNSDVIEMFINKE